MKHKDKNGSFQILPHSPRTFIGRVLTRKTRNSVWQEMFLLPKSDHRSSSLPHIYMNEDEKTMERNNYEKAIINSKVLNVECVRSRLTWLAGDFVIFSTFLILVCVYICWTPKAYSFISTKLCFSQFVSVD